MNYNQRLGAFQSSVADNKNRLDNYTSKVSNIKQHQSDLRAGAKALQDSNIIQGVVSGMSMEAGIRMLKPQAVKALSWADKKIGGRISKDTEGLKDGFKKYGKKVGKRILKRAGISQGQPKAQAEGKEEAEGKTEANGETEPDRVPSTEAEGKGDDGGSTPDDPDMSYTRGRAGQKVEEDLDDYKGTPDDFNIDGDVLSKNTFTGDTLEEGVQRRRMGQEDFDVNAEEDVSAETKQETDLKADRASNKATDLENKTDGADDEGDGGGEEKDGDDAGEALAEDGGEEAGEEGAGGILEGVGAAFDSTGIGAVIGVPLNIAGAIVEGLGLYQAGKGIGDWFNEDVLGNKAPVKIPDMKLPNAPLTMASQGLQATPTFDTTMDVGGGVGGW